MMLVSILKHYKEIYCEKYRPSQDLNLDLSINWDRAHSAEQTA